MLTGLPQALSPWQVCFAETEAVIREGPSSASLCHRRARVAETAAKAGEQAALQRAADAEARAETAESDSVAAIEAAQKAAAITASA